jgi:flavin reductase (DIM6/NTAB) family NADH-FMN oxidoreductase RutF
VHAGLRSQIQANNMKKKSFPLSKVYTLLEPGPVVLVTVAGKRRPNVMPMSWHMMVEFEPPLIAFIISNRNYTFDILKTSKNCVLNIPTVELAKEVVQCGNRSGRKVDKFEAFQLTPEAASLVKAPLIKECYANLECKVFDGRLVEKYCMFVLEVVKAWIDPLIKAPATLHHTGRGNFMVAGKRIKLSSLKK